MVSEIVSNLIPLSIAIPKDGKVIPLAKRTFYCILFDSWSNILQYCLLLFIWKCM